MSADAIKAAMSVAADLSTGSLTEADLGDLATAECRELFGTVVGPEDPLWPLHLDVARQVLARSGVPEGELTEWLAVARRARPDAETPGISDPMGHSGDTGGVRDADLPTT
ncbi:flagellar hook-length control protein [Rhodococcus zopfii]|uniref:flagellar hook-length control protein n=1 Tax=Rhodococcus zopfii TaxID=43772 RepID=UPI00365504DA